MSGCTQEDFEAMLLENISAESRGLELFETCSFDGPSTLARATEQTWWSEHNTLMEALYPSQDPNLKGARSFAALASTVQSSWWHGYATLLDALYPKAERAKSFEGESGQVFDAPLDGERPSNLRIALGSSSSNAPISREEAESARVLDAPSYDERTSTLRIASIPTVSQATTLQGEGTSCTQQHDGIVPSTMHSPSLSPKSRQAKVYRQYCAESPTPRRRIATDQDKTSRAWKPSNLAQSKARDMEATPPRSQQCATPCRAKTKRGRLYHGARAPRHASRLRCLSDTPDRSTPAVAAAEPLDLRQCENTIEIIQGQEDINASHALAQDSFLQPPPEEFHSSPKQILPPSPVAPLHPVSLDILEDNLRLETTSQPSTTWHQPESLPSFNSLTCMENTKSRSSLQMTVARDAAAVAKCLDQALVSPHLRRNLLQESAIISRADLRQLRAVAQVEAKFIVAQLRRDLLLIVDQHAAAERVELERLQRLVIDARDASTLEPAPLSSPAGMANSAVNVPVAAEEARWLAKHRAHVERWGFRFTLEGSEAARVTHVPDVLGTRLVPTDLKAMATEAETTGTLAPPRVILHILTFKACRRAVKFGDPLSPTEMTRLLDNLSRCDYPFQCAHGRPTLYPLLRTGVAMQQAAALSRQKPLARLLGD